MERGETMRKNNIVVWLAFTGIVFVSITATMLLMFQGNTLRLYETSPVVYQADDMVKGIQETRGSPEEFSLENFGKEYNTIVYQGKEYRRKSYVKAILLIGVDQADTSQTQQAGQGGQADSIIIAAWDTARNQSRFIMIPRDTMTKIILTNLAGDPLGVATQHLTLAYAYGDGREKSVEYTQKAVTNLLGGLSIDHYFVMNTSAIHILNEMVGGVDVTIPMPMERVDERFIEGNRVHLEGELAERFLRYRDSEKDFSAMDRMASHKAYMLGFFEAIQMKSKQDTNLIEMMLESVEEQSISDMDKAQKLRLTLDILGKGEITEDGFFILEGENVKTEMYDEFYIDQEKMQDMVLSLFYKEG